MSKALTPKEKEIRSFNCFTKIIKEWETMIKEYELFTLYANNGYVHGGCGEIDYLKSTFKELENESWKYYNIFLADIERGRKIALNEADYLRLTYEQFYKNFIYGTNQIWIPIAKLFSNNVGELNITTSRLAEPGLYIEDNRDEIHFDWNKFKETIDPKNGFKTFATNIILVPYVVGMARICQSLTKILTKPISLKSDKLYSSFKLVDGIEKSSLTPMYDSLSDQGYINCSFRTFQSIFNKKQIQPTHKVSWNKSIPSLLFFIRLLHTGTTQICQNQYDYITAATKCFSKEGASIEIKQLRKPSRLTDSDKRKINHVFRVRI